MKGKWKNLHWTLATAREPSDFSVWRGFGADHQTLDVAIVIQIPIALWSPTYRKCNKFTELCFVFDIRTAATSNDTIFTYDIKLYQK